MTHSNVMWQHQLGPTVSQLRKELETFNSRLKAEIGIDVTQTYTECELLIGKCIEKLKEWRHVNNYPSFRAHPDDANVLDEFQCLFETAGKSIKLFEGKLIVMTNRKFDLDEKLKEITQLRQKLVSKCFVMERNPCQAIVNRDEQENAERKTPKRKKTDADEKPKKDTGVEIKMVVRCLLPLYWKEMNPEVTIYDFFDHPVSDESQKKEAKVEITSTEKGQKNSIGICCRIKDVDNLGIRQQNMYFLRIEFHNSSNSAVVETLPIGFCCNVSQMPTLSCYLLWYNAVSQTHDPCLTQRNFPLSFKLEYLIEVLDSEFHNDESCLAKWVRVLGGRKTVKTRDNNITFSDHNKECLANMLGAHGPTYILHTGISKAPWRRGEDIVSFDFFAKKKNFGSKSKFTFWTWFYACYRTMCSNMPNLYAEGLVAGFMTYDQAVETLSEARSRETQGSEILLLRFTNSYVGSCGGETKWGLVCPTTITAYGESKRWQAINGEEEKRAKESGIVEVLLEDTKPVGAVKEEYAENLLVLTRDGKCVPFSKAFEKFGFRVTKKSRKKFDDSEYTNQMKELLKDLEASSIRSDGGNSNGNSLRGDSSFVMSPTSTRSGSETMDSREPANYLLDSNTDDQQLPSLPHFGSFLNDVGEPMNSAQSDFLQPLEGVRNTMEEEEEELVSAQGGWA